MSKDGWDTASLIWMINSHLNRTALYALHNLLSGEEIRWTDCRVSYAGHSSKNIREKFELWDMAGFGPGTSEWNEMGGFSRVNINMSAVYLSHSQLHLSKPSHTYIQLFSAVNLSSRAPFALRQRVLIMPILCSRTNYTNVFYKETGKALNLSSHVSWEPTNLQSKINGKENAYVSRHMYLEYLAGVLLSMCILFKMRVPELCTSHDCECTVTDNSQLLNL